MSVFTISYKGITKHYNSHEEALKMAAWLGLKESDIVQGSMFVKWKD